jgi:DNA (cytosine-5)-methyltransferase 1
VLRHLQTQKEDTLANVNFVEIQYIIAKLPMLDVVMNVEGKVNTMEQLDMFEFTHEELPKVERIKLGTFFSGIGAPEMALKNMGIDYDLQFFSEINKYAIQSYMAIHNEPVDKSVGSITELKGSDLPYCDMWFGGFPCQDISLAGKGKGFAFETESRSSLGWEMIRLLREVETMPTYVVFENVAAIFNNTHRPVLNLFKRDLEELGYTLYNKLLNSKDYGIPQNRNRYFLVAIKGEYSFKFPRKQKLKLRLKDLLEDEVDEKYYLSDKMMKYIYSSDNDKKTNGSGTYQGGKLEINRDIAVTVTTREGNTRADSSNYISIIGSTQKNASRRSDGISPGLTSAMGTGGGHVPMIKIPEATKKGYSEATDGDGIYLDRPHQKRGVVQKGMTPTIKTSGDDIGVVVKGLRIRKLTPKECFRLQGFSDQSFENAAMVVSNSQLYKQAGNSITVNVLMEIFNNLLGGIK